MLLSMNDCIVSISVYTLLTLYAMYLLALYGTRSIVSNAYCNVHNVATWQCQKQAQVHVLVRGKFTVLVYIIKCNLVIKYLN
jgi:hypothetical protein